MKNNDDNTGALSALLRTADSVDTLATKSLCCAAAGIIATSNTTAEALIPHEKLRGAALADATLNAQERPLAQPVVGYTPLLMFDRQFHCSQLTSRDRDRLRVVREDSGTPHRIFICSIREQTGKDNTLIKSPPNHQEGLNHFWKRQIHRVDPLQSHQLCFYSSDNLRFKGDITGLNVSKIVKEQATYSCRTIRHATNKLKDHLVTLASSSHSIAGLFVANVKGCTYRRDASKRLKPCCSILLHVERLDHYKQRPAQSTNSKEKPYHPNTCDFQTLQNFEPHKYQRPTATNLPMSLTGFQIGVHGGAI